jgi:hypothetical protein
VRRFSPRARVRCPVCAHRGRKKSLLAANKAILFPPRHVMTRVWIHSRILLSARTQEIPFPLSHFLFLSLWAGGNRSAAYRNKSERKTRAYHAARPKNTLAANSSVRDEIARRKPHNIFGDGDARTRRSIKTLAPFPCPRAGFFREAERPPRGTHHAEAAQTQDARKSHYLHSAPLAL